MNSIEIISIIITALVFFIYLNNRRRFEKGLFGIFDFHEKEVLKLCRENILPLISSIALNFLGWSKFYELMVKYISYLILQ